ncbi:MAG TPA: hypothetical protein VFY09_03085 [Flavobacteriaceae bacterium]|jgi:hypothetical protein|nr:hypothetical protein [Flavobacteriaceae bacterium]HEX5742867.1 hypothetical protein [Flavobacteriaceae bacterium]
MNNKFLIYIYVALLSFPILAQGNLMITPTRVVFEGNKQKEELNLANMGSETATYSISFVQKNMKEDGSFENVEILDSLAFYADPYLRIFPRTVTLAPRESQSVIVQFRRKAGMQSGEYRSHLYFRSEKDYTPLSQDKDAKDSTLLSVSITPIFGMSIPIIIRTGDVSVSASISNPKLETTTDNFQNLLFTINRVGNISLYGDISIQFIPQQGTPFEVGSLNGVGIYTSIDYRKMNIQLTNPKGGLLSKGKLKITYNSKNDGKSVVYCSSELDIK